MNVIRVISDERQRDGNVIASSTCLRVELFANANYNRVKAKKHHAEGGKVVEFLYSNRIGVRISLS
jgi:hypothetical protein